MFNNTPHGANMVQNTKPSIPLDLETRANLPTPEAAFHLNRAQQTLRLWAMRENGPLRPIRVNGRLAWPVAELRKVLHVPATEQKQLVAREDGQAPKQFRRSS
jgi:hypothetical protein